MTGAHLIPDYSVDAIELRDLATSTALRVKKGEIRATVGTTSLTVAATGIIVKGNLTVTGTVTGGIVKSRLGRNLDLHTHSGVATGQGITGAPV